MSPEGKFQDPSQKLMGEMRHILFTFQLINSSTHRHLTKFGGFTYLCNGGFVGIEIFMCIPLNASAFLSESFYPGSVLIDIRKRL